MSRTELERKQVDDVLGGAEAWKNVDSTDGEFLVHYKRLVQNARILELTLCKYKFVLLMSLVQFFTNAAMHNATTNGEKDELNAYY